MCLCCSLTLHIPVSCPTGCSLQGTPAGPCSFLGTRRPALGQQRWSFLPPCVFFCLCLCSPSPRSSAAAQGCGVMVRSLPSAPNPGYWKERATCACHAFHVQILSDQEKDLDSLSKKFTVIFWISLLTPLCLAMRRGSKRSTFFSCPCEAMWAIWAVAVLYHLTETHPDNWVEKGRTTLTRHPGPAEWAVKGELMLPPCCSASADAGTCRKWERLPALGLAPEAARGLLVSLQGHGCVCQSTSSWFGVAPKFSVCSKFRFRVQVHGVTRAVWWQWRFGAR